MMDIRRMSLMGPTDAEEFATSVGLRPVPSPLLDLVFDPFRCA